MHLLMLAHALDRGAQAVASRMSPTLGQRLLVLRPEWLGQAIWSQRLDVHGKSHTRLRWSDQSCIDSTQLALVWNRIQVLPQAAFRGSPQQDRVYAGAELQALVASWLAELGQRASPAIRRHGAVPAILHPIHWQAAAARCGLALSPPPSPVEDFAVLRTPREIHAPLLDLGAPLQHACHALAAELGYDLLSLGFRGSPQAPLLCRVDAHPALSSPGEVQAVANWLCGRLMQGTAAALTEVSA